MFGIQPNQPRVRRTWTLSLITLLLLLEAASRSGTVMLTAILPFPAPV